MLNNMYDVYEDVHEDAPYTESRKSRNCNFVFLIIENGKSDAFFIWNLEYLKNTLLYFAVHSNGSRVKPSEINETNQKEKKNRFLKIIVLKF